MNNYQLGTEMKEEGHKPNHFLTFLLLPFFKTQNFAKCVKHSTKSFNPHFRKHKNQLKLLIRTKKIDLNCIICCCLSKSYDEWELHVTSEQHVENAKKYKPIMPVEIPPPNQAHHVIPIPQQLVQQNLQIQSTSSIPPLLPPHELIELTAKLESSLNQKALRQIVAQEKKELKCTHCNVTCQSACSWQAHLASKKHHKNKHRFHTYPGISKEFVKKKYQTSFVRAAETFGNEFIEDNVVFFCKRCDYRMQTKAQLEVHMSSNQHKMNHPIAPPPVADPYPSQNNQQLFNFESSSYGYGFRNWNGEQHLMNRPVPQVSQAELYQQQETERQRQLVEKAKIELLARFPFYALHKESEQLALSVQPENIPMPVQAPQPVAAPVEIPENYGGWFQSN